jgi:hypothetical protein
MSTCFDGIERVEETESRIEDHKSCGGASGVDDLDASMVFEVQVEGASNAATRLGLGKVAY